MAMKTVKVRSDDTRYTHYEYIYNDDGTMCYISRYMTKEYAEKIANSPISEECKEWMDYARG